MNKLSGIVTIALALSVAAGCQSRDHAPAASNKESAAVAATAAPPAATAASLGHGGAAGELGKSAVTNRALVVTMDVAITVEDVDGARDRIKGRVERAGGYIADANTADRHATMDLRIPAASVGSIHEALRSMGEVTLDSEKVQDVTEEKADLEARLKNSRVQEKRVLEIMTNKTGAISEVISAETELARIRETIERMEAQKRTLDSKIDLATVHVTLNTKVVPVPMPEELPAWKTPGKSIAEAAKAGGRAAAAFAVYALMAFAATAPFTLPLVAIALTIVAVLKNKKKKQLAAMMSV